MDPQQQKKLDTIIYLLSSINNSNKLSWKSVLRSFSLGIATALGATVGLAIFFTILGYVVHSLGGVPGVGRWFSDLGHFLQTSRTK